MPPNQGGQPCRSSVAGQHMAWWGRRRSYEISASYEYVYTADTCKTSRFVDLTSYNQQRAAMLRSFNTAINGQSYELLLYVCVCPCDCTQPDEAHCARSHTRVSDLAVSDLGVYESKALHPNSTVALPSNKKWGGVSRGSGARARGGGGVVCRGIQRRRLVGN
eukprot:SAG11_NODE_4811_length_1758_cov_1.572634_2_plen_163_part_00